MWLTVKRDALKLLFSCGLMRRPNPYHFHILRLSPSQDKQDRS